jgi:hypothetical protein
MPSPVTRRKSIVEEGQSDNIEEKTKSYQQQTVIGSTAC